MSVAELRARVRDLVASSGLRRLVELVDPPEDAIEISLSQTRLRVALPVEVSTLSVGLPMDYWNPEARSLGPVDVLVGAAFVLERIGATAEAAQLFAAAAKESYLAAIPDIAKRLTRLLVMHGRARDLVDLVHRSSWTTQWRTGTWPPGT